MPTVWTFTCKHRAEIETSDYLNITKKTSQELCPDCKELRQSIPKEVNMAHAMQEQRIDRQVALNDFLQEKVNKVEAKGRATYQLKERDSITLGLGMIYKNKNLREWNQPKVDMTKIALADWVKKSPQETYHFHFTPLEKCLLDAQTKVKIFKEADEAVLRLEDQKVQRDEERLKSLKLRISAWKNVEFEFNQFGYHLKHYQQNGMTLNTLEKLFEAVMEKASKLLYPNVTDEQELAALELKQWQNFQDPTTRNSIEM